MTFVAYPRVMDDVDDGIDGHNPGHEVLDEAWPYLTVMQRAIAIHLMAGRSNKEIADHFELSRQRVSRIIDSMRTRMHRRQRIG